MHSHSLTVAAREQLAAARDASSSRAAVTLYGGHEHSLRQTVIALIQGQSLAEHSTLGEATLQVLGGRIRLSAGALDHDASEGDLVVIPDEPHSVFAVEDAVILLTVVVADAAAGPRATEAPLDQPLQLGTRQGPHNG